jgi:hypothetical protein
MANYIGVPLTRPEIWLRRSCLFTSRGWMLRDGETVPGPSTLETLMRDPNCVGAAAFLVVHVPEPKPRTVRVNITVPEDTLRHIDSMAKQRGMSRSSFLVHAARNAAESDAGIYPSNAR